MNIPQGLFTRVQRFTGKGYYGWIGWVEFWQAGEKLWSKSCEVLRVYKNDARRDAERLYKELKERNQYASTTS